ncbi:GGDEF domain-containing protein [Desulfovibrio sp. TomC]|uniref:GGDEF domain-containing protein n=1 Tax=Desulfovibrio sp. TomC TaxID=1562888 RepID=UPI0005746A24|nr:GGDEF domain-containing protein [Desulfovibrio sp. TomC]KHK00357.1 diguanylate cyclase/phosphodiesterase (GGDEF & EAL domains) with PAS/PAC sensor(s) [Desulfovibrio sp. TomC]
MSTLKIKSALVLGILVVTFTFSQGLYRNNISALHDSLFKSIEITEEVHEAEAFHSAMHSMLISASAYDRIHDYSFEREYLKYREIGESTLAKLRNRAKMLPSPGHASHGADNSKSILDNLADSFQTYKSTLDNVFNKNTTSAHANISAGRNIFDTIFHKYYATLHSTHSDRLDSIKSEASRIYRESNVLFIAQLIAAILAGILVVVFVDRVFIKIYKLTKQHSLTDALTSLHNRRYLEKIIEDEFQVDQRPLPSVSAILLDIDNFKQYNDQNGHVAGDHLLKDLASVLKRSIRKTDRLVRYGGEEFLVLLPETSKAEAAGVAEKIRAVVEASQFHLPDGCPASQVTVSVGVATMPEDAGHVEQLIKTADDLLYRAKREGKNRVSVSSCDSGDTDA